MTKKVSDPPVVVECEEIPGLLPELTLLETKYSNGSVSFRALHGQPLSGEELEKARKIVKYTLLCETLDELDEERGTFTMLDVLKESGLYNEEDFAISLKELMSDQFRGFDDNSKLIADIEQKLDPGSWDLFKRRLDSFGPNPDETGRRSAFVTAVWADRFAEPGSTVWLAAMAQFEEAIGNSFAFGYLIAQLNQKREVEPNFLRGKKSVESAREGGLARSKVLRPATEGVLAEMRRLVNSGLSATRSAALAFQRGFGKSAAANARLWSRRKK